MSNNLGNILNLAVASDKLATTPTNTSLADSDADGFLAQFLKGTEKNSQKLAKFSADSNENSAKNSPNLNENLTENLTEKINLETLTNSDILATSPINEVDKNELFANLNFAQLLSVLDEMSIKSSNIKFSELSAQAQSLLKTDENLSLLKDISNLDELLDLAKELKLNLKSLKIEFLANSQSLEKSYPNLAKTNFFKTSLDNSLKSLINEKISNLLSTQNTAKTELKSSQSMITQALNLVDDDFKDMQILKKAAEKSVNSSLNSSLNSQKNGTKSENLQQNLNGILNDKNLNNKNADPTNKALNTNTKSPLSEILSNETPLKNENFDKNLAKNLDDENIKNEPLNELKVPKNEPLNAKDAVDDLWDFEKNSQNLTKNLNSQENSQNFKDLNALKDTQNVAQSTQKQVILNSTKPLTLQELEINDEKGVELSSDNKELNTNAQKQTQNATKNVNLNAQLLNENFKDKASAENTKSTTSSVNLNANLSTKSGNFNANNFSESYANVTNSENLNANAANLNATNLNNDLSVNLNANLSAKNATQSVNISTESLLQATKITADGGVEFNELLVTNDEIQSISTDSNNANDLTSLIKDLSQISKSELKAQINIKETFTHFAQDFQEKMSQFKPPITRFNITLHPESLGEVEVSITQRGQNLQVNFSSNSSTMSLFLQHQAEFKNSLVNMGFMGLEMNFSEQGKKDREQEKSRSFAKGKFDESVELSSLQDTQNTSENLGLTSIKYF